MSTPRRSSISTLDNFRQLGNDIRRVALEAFRSFASLCSADQEGQYVTTPSDVDQTITQIETQVEVMRQDFQYDEANAFDKLLIEQILVAWVQWYVASWLLDGQLAQNRTWRENQYFTQRYQQCQSRLTRSIDQLAKLRMIHPSRLMLETQADRDARAERLRIHNQSLLGFSYCED